LRIPNFDTATITQHLNQVHKDSGASVSTPIIGISASQQDHYGATLKRFGLNDFLTKPVDQAQLFTVIKKHVFSNTLEVEAARAPGIPVTAQDNRDFLSLELKQLFLEQALVLRPTFNQYFHPNTNSALLDALHLVQGSAAALALFDLQQAAQILENSIRTKSNNVEKYLNFLRLYDQQIIFFRQSLNVTTQQAHQVPPQTNTKQSNHPMRHFNILLIDDNVLVTKVLGSQIEAKGLSIDFAYSSEEALLKLDTHQYDILVTDLILPDIDGLALTKIVTAQPRFKDKIIFGLSAYASDTINQGCKNAGMKHLYSKLSDPSALIATLVETVNSLNSEQR
jgi:CheY-like chemotaxis protein/HPt (histidine-containing phosphotransfer) domain-containing protein